MKVIEYNLKLYLIKIRVLPLTTCLSLGKLLTFQRFNFYVHPVYNMEVVNYVTML